MSHFCLVENHTFIFVGGRIFSISTLCNKNTFVQYRLKARNSHTFCMIQSNHEVIIWNPVKRRTLTLSREDVEGGLYAVEALSIGQILQRDNHISQNG